MGCINTYQNRKKKYIPYFHLYVLALECDKYYVGISRNVKKRFDAHQRGEGAEWTKLYKPLKVISDTQLAFCSYTKVKPYEDQKTIELMKKYGRENVRGGMYCAIDQNIVDSFLGDNLCKEIDAAAEASFKRRQRIETKRKKKEAQEIRNKPLNEILKGFQISIYKINVPFPKKKKRQLITRFVVIQCKDRMLRIPIMIDYKNKIFYVSDIHMNRYGKQIEKYFGGEESLFFLEKRS